MPCRCRTSCSSWKKSHCGKHFLVKQSSFCMSIFSINISIEAALMCSSRRHDAMSQSYFMFLRRERFAEIIVNKIIAVLSRRQAAISNTHDCFFFKKYIFWKKTRAESNDTSVQDHWKPMSKRNLTKHASFLLMFFYEKYYFHFATTLQVGRTDRTTRSDHIIIDCIANESRLPKSRSWYSADFIDNESRLSKIRSRSSAERLE